MFEQYQPKPAIVIAKGIWRDFIFDLWPFSKNRNGCYIENPSKRTCAWRPKGQVISKADTKVFISTKNQRKYFCTSALARLGRNTMLIVNNFNSFKLTLEDLNNKKSQIFAKPAWIANWHYLLLLTAIHRALKVVQTKLIIL